LAAWLANVENKMARRLTLVDATVIIGIGIVCFPVFLILLPNIKASRSEARLSIAFNEVRRLRQTLTNEDSSESVTTLPDIDPWGQPYRVILLNGHQVRVASAGPNKSFSPTGIDDDDIYSDMPAGPCEAAINRKRWQILIAMGAALGIWVSLSTVYLWRR
jgi:hypothetical protein